MDEEEKNKLEELKKSLEEEKQNVDVHCRLILENFLSMEQSTKKKY